MTIAGYDAFISYSHDADMDLAPAVRTGLQRLAKKWNRRRALSIFLDQSSLELTSELRAALDKRIGDTRWLVLLMSEVSAESEWVGAEIEQWTQDECHPNAEGIELMAENFDRAVMQTFLPGNMAARGNTA